MPINLTSISGAAPFSLRVEDTARLTHKSAKSDVGKDFEAFVMQSFIQEMLPKDAESVFGKGVAGDIWKSLLAEKLAHEVADRGTLGIADLARRSAHIGSGSRIVDPASLPGAGAILTESAVGSEHDAQSDIATLAGS